MRVRIKNVKNPPGGIASILEQEVTVKGWVKTIRNQKTFSFVEINDGSTLGNLQVVVDQSVPDYHNIVGQISTGASVVATGKVVESPAKGQKVEIQAKTIELIGTSDPETYPLQKKRHTFEFLRTIAHLRPRTNTIGAISRVRHALAMATHLFFQEKGFVWVSTPIITGSDCEGAGELFRVSTLDLEDLPKTEEGKIDYSQDFFGQSSYLTVSGQLNAEIYALSLSDVYTFGPTFRAENSNTSRHLAEFWMIEPEMAFADINDDMDLAEEFLKYVLKYVLDHCEEDMAFFDKFIAKGCLEKLKHVVETPFERSTYSYAIRILEKSTKKFEFPVKWGLDLQSEHERYLAEEFFGKPVILTDYPRDIKPFYMKQNADEKTVACLDVLVPGVGEIIGGSQREDRLDVLERKIDEAGLNKDDYWWYLELRKYGSVPHAGFGVGFERLIQYVTGMDNIRDVIPFPRTPGKAEF
ncbi:MAG: Asparagine--tRNA ligase [Chlamydiae bacterium]|nr:Asparagine--tRNA ligase [Chlamydiota bacterium]